MRDTRRRAILRHGVWYAIIVAVSGLVGAYLTGFFHETVGVRIVIAAVALFLFAGGVISAIVAYREGMRGGNR